MNNAYEPVGYLASLLVLATFSVRAMVPLRWLAIASNVAFVGYAALAGIGPVLALHAVLLPLNVYRLLQASRQPCGATPDTVEPVARQCRIGCRLISGRNPAESGGGEIIAASTVTNDKRVSP